jgi:hypothetical protein
MAYRERGMWGVLEVLRRVHAGETHRSMARGTGWTPKRYAATPRRQSRAGSPVESARPTSNWTQPAGPVRR